MRYWLGKPWIFYPLLAVLAALLIAWSLRPEWPPTDAKPQPGVTLDGTLVFSGAMLTHVQTGPEHVASVSRDERGRPVGMRLARTMESVTTPAPDDPGAILTITPEAGAFIATQPAVIEVFYRPVPVTTAEGLAVRLDGSTPGVWAEAPLDVGGGSVRFNTSPSGGAPTRIALRVLSTRADYNYGLEIVEVRITPQPAGAP